MTKEKARSQPLHVALAGAGMISHYHLIAWRNLGERARVVAICDPDLKRAERRAEEFGIAHAYDRADAMLDAEAINALDVASPRETHASWVEAAAARGIDVLCQKPLTPTLAEAEALAERVRDRIRLMVHENWRFRPWYRLLSKWMAAGEVGEIFGGHLVMASSGFLPDENGRRPSLVRQPFMQHEARLMLAEVLIHQLDVVRWLAGPLRVVSARAMHSISDIVGETLATVLLETASGAPIVVSGTMAAPGYPPRTQDRLELYGRKATAVLAGTELSLLGPTPRRESYDFDAGYQASFDGVMVHFVECLASGAPFETRPEDNLETLRLVEHAYWAAGLHTPAVR
jgi:predicted dehydrogenase